MTVSGRRGLRATEESSRHDVRADTGTPPPARPDSVSPVGGTGDVRAAVVRRVDFGTAELVPDPTRPAAWTLLVDGVEQSYVDLDDPTRLPFEYVRRLASVVDAAGPAGAPLRVLHLGGGAMSLPRYVSDTRPGSAQRVVERDGALVDLVARVLPLPAGTTVEVRVGDARTAVEAEPAGAYDLVVADVYEAARMPRRVASVQFAAAVARVVRPGGCYAVNLTDLPPLAFSRTQVATLRTALADVGVVGEAAMLRGRRYGNLVAVAVAAPGVVPVAKLARRAARDPAPGRVLHGAALDGFVGGARPLTDGPGGPPSGR
jgi:spermidine synthase